MRDELIVLTLPVLDNQTVIGVVGVHREAHPAARRTRITEEPVETVLTLRLLAEDLVAQVDHVRLVASFATRCRPTRGWKPLRGGW